MAQIKTRQATGPGKIKNIQIFSNTNSNKSVFLTDLIIDKFTYYESLFQDVIHASVTYIDGGTAINKKGKFTTAVAGLPITGSEKVNLLFEDPNGEKIKVTLYVNNVTEIIADSTKSMVTLSMNSIELFNNDKVRVHTRENGKISDHIRKILTDPEYLGATDEEKQAPDFKEKELHIEPTVGLYNKAFTNKKPFYMMNYFSTRAVPEGGQGNSAGFLLWETSKGFHFKSVDKLFQQREKRKIMFNETPGNPPKGYDIKALTFTKENRNDIKSKLEQGAYSTRLITFDPFTCNFEVSYLNAGNKKQSGPRQKGNEDTLKTGGDKFPKLNPVIKSAKGGQNDFSRTTFQVLDTGSMPEGELKQGVDQTSAERTGGNEQLNKKEEKNAKPVETLNQAIMRLNQLNTMKISMTLPGDFTLHAGDAVRVDSPQLSVASSRNPGKSRPKVDDQTGGLYIIRDLCHYMTKDVTYTKINVIRDSFGRKV